MEGSLDALLPKQIAERAEDIGASKARMDTPTTLLLAILAGAFIAMGAVFSTVVSAGSAALPFGVARVLAGAAFSLGLVLVVVAGAELFTGNNLLVMAYASRKASAAQVLRNWSLVYIGNFIGGAATAAGMYAAGLHQWGNGQVGATALAIAQAKCSLTWSEALMRGVFCNALVCMALWLCMSCRSTGDKILAIMLPVSAFVAAGFEHSIANMYFIPSGLLIKTFGPAQDLAPMGGCPEVTWGNFFLANLLPVTIGNIIGGALMVGTVYWVVYCRRSRSGDAALHITGRAEHEVPTLQQRDGTRG
ncbi:putative formate transporter 1 [Phycisphaerales bacterium]|nr:putative formate transporter 1 [Phycisphaerales bacterium]